jgi:hypothetical protein
LSCESGRFTVVIYHPFETTNLLQNQATGDRVGRGRGFVWAIEAALSLTTDTAPTTAAIVALAAFGTTSLPVVAITVARIIFIWSVGPGIAVASLLVIRVAFDLQVYVKEDPKGSLSG